MASTFSTRLRFELMGNGDQSGSWGTTTNTNLGTLIEGAIAGYVSFAVTAATQAFTYANGAVDQARMAILNLTGTAGAASVFAPPASKTYTIKNATNGIVTVYNSTVLGNTTAAGAGVAIPVGATRSVWSDGTNFYAANTIVDSATSATSATNATNATNLTGSGTVSATATGGAGLTPTNATNATNLTGSGTISDTATVNTYAVGYRNVPQNSQSAAYTAVLSDAGKHIYHPSADTTARTFTIPANASVAYPVGTAITFVNDTSAGVVTIAITTDTMILAGAGTTGSRTLAANGVATALKITTTRWIISGSGLT